MITNGLTDRAGFSTAGPGRWGRPRWKDPRLFPLALPRRPGFFLRLSPGVPGLLHPRPRLFHRPGGLSTPARGSPGGETARFSPAAPRFSSGSPLIFPGSLPEGWVLRWCSLGFPPPGQGYPPRCRLGRGDAGERQGISRPVFPESPHNFSPAARVYPPVRGVVLAVAPDFHTIRRGYPRILLRQAGAFPPVTGGSPLAGGRFSLASPPAPAGCAPCICDFSPIRRNWNRFSAVSPPTIHSIQEIFHLNSVVFRSGNGVYPSVYHHVFH